MALDILLLGPQGSGKGTQAKRIAEEYGVPHIATGDMLRHAIAEGTEFGRAIQGYLDEGELVPDQLVIDEIRHRLLQDDASEGAVFDGFPRTAAQAEASTRCSPTSAGASTSSSTCSSPTRRC